MNIWTDKQKGEIHIITYMWGFLRLILIMYLQDFGNCTQLRILNYLDE